MNKTKLLIGLRYKLKFGQDSSFALKLKHMNVIFKKDLTISSLAVYLVPYSAGVFEPKSKSMKLSSFYCVFKQYYELGIPVYEIQIKNVSKAALQKVRQSIERHLMALSYNISPTLAVLGLRVSISRL
jgi:hypothetical protein